MCLMFDIKRHFTNGEVTFLLLYEIFEFQLQNVPGQFVLKIFAISVCMLDVNYFRLNLFLKFLVIYFAGHPSNIS